MMKRSLYIFFMMLASLAACSQEVYRAGSIVKNFPIKKLLNHPGSPASFNDVKGRITVLDFFGTWCAPCIRALPHLEALQQQFPGDLKVVLVSVEEEPRLRKFISARKDFSFPVIVDEDNMVTKLFQPPSYPFTLVLDGEGKVLAVTDAGSLTRTAVAAWLSGKKDPAFPQGILTNVIQAKAMKKSSIPIVALSQDFLYAARTGDGTEQLLQGLKNISPQELQQQLKGDREKNAFWINLYNAFTTSILKKNPGLYEDRGAFFKAKQIEIAGRSLSLDDIEHGILRRSRIKWSLGHLGKPFPSSFEKKMRVAKPDHRIHFALNCGAKSCPPIAYYSEEDLDVQLELAANNYLQNEAENDGAKNELRLPAIMGWFRADFGGKKGMRELLTKHGLLPEGARPKVRFKKYDWSLYLDHYKNDIQ